MIYNKMAKKTSSFLENFFLYSKSERHGVVTILLVS